MSGEPHPLLEFAKFKIKKKYNVTIYMINELTVNINFVKWFDPPPLPPTEKILGPRLIEIISDYLQTEKHILASDNCFLEA